MATESMPVIQTGMLNNLQNVPAGYMVWIQIATVRKTCLRLTTRMLMQQAIWINIVLEHRPKAADTLLLTVIPITATYSVAVLVVYLTSTTRWAEAYISIVLDKLKVTRM